MKRKGFTLVEVLLGIFLLGLISITILPIVNSSLMNINRNKIKMEMIYIGEMAIERIKSYNPESDTAVYISDKKVTEIIELFRNKNSSEIFIYQEENSGKYLLKIVKNQRTNNLWEIRVYVYHDEKRSNLSHVEYKTYILKK